MKSILASIRPMWCEKIFDGSKTMELRKTKPSVPTPFKVYVYCTKSIERIITIGPDKIEGNGFVCAEFICDYILGRCEMANADIAEQQSLVRRENIYYYSGCGNHEIFGWHISDLVIYDEPKKLSDFKRHDPTYDFAFFGEMDRTYSVSRPPQSWMYVEKLK